MLVENSSNRYYLIQESKFIGNIGKDREFKMKAEAVQITTIIYNIFASMLETL